MDSKEVLPDVNSVHKSCEQPSQAKTTTEAKSPNWTDWCGLASDPQAQFPGRSGPPPCNVTRHEITF
jgi:hypothetical protein